MKLKTVNLQHQTHEPKAVLWALKTEISTVDAGAAAAEWQWHGAGCWRVKGL